MAKHSSKEFIARQFAVEQKIVGYIRDYQKEHGYSPALSEIGNAFGHTRQWAWYWLQHLERKEIITLKDGQHRSIVLR